MAANTIPTYRETNEKAPLTKTQKTEKGKLTVEEKRFTGQVGISTYFFYFRMGGLCFFFLYVVITVVEILTSITSNWWITRWTLDSFDLPNNQYLLVYFLFGMVIFCELMLVGFFLLSIAINASYNIFNKMVWSVLRRPMKFFDTNPSGIILNRFTGDMVEVDDRVPFLLQLFLSLSLRVVVIFVVASILSPSITILVIVGGILSVYSCVKFLRTTTELKRLNQLSLSPVISIVSELVQGVTTIRNYQQVENTLAKFAKKADV